MNFFGWLDRMGYPHWMIIFGCVLLVIGFFGFAFQKNKNIGTRRSATSAEGSDGSGF
jgi:hypothetical protein